MTRAEDLVEHERDRVKILEQTLKLLQSSSSTSGTSSISSSRSQSQTQTQSTGAGEGEDEEDSNGMMEGEDDRERRLESKIEGLEMKGLSVMQRRKIMMLRNKRDRLEKERSRLGLGE